MVFWLNDTSTIEIYSLSRHGIGSVLGLGFQKRRQASDVLTVRVSGRVTVRDSIRVRVWDTVRG